MGRLSGIYVHALFLAYDAVHRDAPDSGLGLLLDLLLGLGRAVPMAEKEVALLDFLLELLP